MFIRKMANRPGNIAVQVVEKVNRRNKVLKHLGTAKTSLELNHLTKLGQEYVDRQRINSGVISFFESRFEKSDKGSHCLNQPLIKKAKQLEGLKGYISNAAELGNEEIIDKYSELWQVEKAFRMSKSDLKDRPISHTVDYYNERKYHTSISLKTPLEFTQTQAKLLTLNR